MLYKLSSIDNMCEPEVKLQGPLQIDCIDYYPIATPLAAPISNLMISLYKALL